MITAKQKAKELIETYAVFSEGGLKNDLKTIIENAKKSAKVLVNEMISEWGKEGGRTAKQKFWNDVLIEIEIFSIEFEEKDEIIPKGSSIKYLDYTIKNSLNSDGLVLFKDDGELYESNLGNYGSATKENIDYCKKSAILHYMVCRPNVFARTVVRKIRKVGSGTYHEFFLLKDSIISENIDFPKEITCGDGTNCMIWFNDEPMFK